MKRRWIKYARRPVQGPMTPWARAPSRTPRPVPGRGYPVFHVELDGFVFRFAGLDEIEHLASVFERRILPPTLSTRPEQEAVGRTTPFWRNRHWLSRLPARVKPFRYRRRVAPYLRECAAAFAREIGEGHGQEHRRRPG